MSFNSTTCPYHGTYEFYGRYVPACPKCGYPELKTSEEYYKSMGCGNILNYPGKDNSDGVVKRQQST